MSIYPESDRLSIEDFDCATEDVFLAPDMPSAPVPFWMDDYGPIDYVSDAEALGLDDDEIDWDAINEME